MFLCNYISNTFFLDHRLFLPGKMQHLKGQLSIVFCPFLVRTGLQGAEPSLQTYVKSFTLNHFKMRFDIPCGTDIQIRKLSKSPNQNRASRQKMEYGT